MADKPRRWQRGEPLQAERLNYPLDELERISGLLPPRVRGADVRPLGPGELPDEDERAEDDEAENVEDLDEVSTDEETAEELIENVENWKFVSKTTRTERIEDADDPTTFVDLTITTSVTVRTPDNTRITIALE